MAGKFFNQKVKGSSNKSMVAYVIVGACILLIFICVIMVVVFSNRSTSTPDPIIEIRDVVTIEINSEIPDKTLFFAELQNVSEEEIDVSFENVDLSKVGNYVVDIEIYGNTYTSTLTVVDTETPVLNVKNYNVAVGESYDANDFVESCTDNSGEDCTIEFYELGMDQDGNTLDYSSFTEEGVYSVQIVASDSSGNATSPMTAQLTIGESGENEPPTYCNFGNSEYDSNTYILGVNVTQNGCALDLNLYYNDQVTAPAHELVKSDTEQIRKEINKLNISNVKLIHFNQLITPVLNIAGTGIVGYTIQQQINIEYNDGTIEEIANYYINTDGERIYSLNKYNLS